MDFSSGAGLGLVTSSLISCKSFRVLINRGGGGNHSPERGQGRQPLMLNAAAAPGMSERQPLMI